MEDFEKIKEIYLKKEKKNITEKIYYMKNKV